MPLENEESTPAGDEPVVETSLLDSINEALAPTLPETPVADEPVVDEETDDDEDEGEGDEDGEGAAKDGERNADGTFKAKPKAEADGSTPKGDAAPKLGADGKPVPAVGADGKPVVEPKKADPVNDPIPDEVKGRTRERMQSLISAVKEKDSHIAIQNELVDSISSTGASPEEFGAMLGYMRWVHSDKPEDLKQARDLLLSELEGLSLKLGEAAPGVNFLAKFPDLQAKVDNGQITTEDANEMALHRQRTTVETTRRTQQQTTEQSAQAATQARNAGIAELNELGKTLSTTDVDFAIKHEILKPILGSLGQLPPTSWKAAFTQAYNAVTPAQVERFRTPVVIAPKQKAPGSQPLRAGKVPSGGQQRAPKSLLDAISAAVDEAG